MSAMRRDLGAAALGEARLWLGMPYRHQASLKGVGCDCLGLVRGVWRAIHGAEPEATPAYTRDWAEARGDEALAEAARRHLEELADPHAYQLGDVLLFRYRVNPTWIAAGGALVGLALANWSLTPIY